MGVAKEGVKYAIIENGAVNQIFTSTEMKEWDEDALHVIELKTKEAKDIVVGDSFDAESRVFKEKTLQDFKKDKIKELEFSFQMECSVLRENTTPEEFSTWDIQAREANEYIKKPQSAHVPLLQNLAAKREMNPEALATEIIIKNDAYKENMGKLLGNIQNLKKRAEGAKNRKELDAITYESPLKSEGGE